MFVTTLVLLASAALCHSKLYDSVVDLPTLSYDFVVVGGGTAGSVVASRLSEGPFSVLLLEGGVSNEGVVVSEAPFLVNEMLGQRLYSYNYTTTPQTGLNGRSIAYPRARILGGCSAHNGLFYTRGAADDFNRYAELTQDPSWSWDRVLPYFLKNERWSPPADGHDTTGEFEPRFHSTTGVNSVSLAGFRWSTASLVMQTTQELPHDFPFNLDQNSGHPLGVGWLQSTVGGGQRSTAATSYLRPEVQQRPNLHILLNAPVSRLLANQTDKGVVFNAVQFSQSSVLSTVSAKKEIILSAGSVGTPHLLLNSGVGNKTTLEALGIPVLIDLPSVGLNVSDHAAVIPTWTVNTTMETSDDLNQNPELFNQAFAEWNATKTGPFTILGVTHNGYFRVDLETDTFSGFKDPSAGPGAPHFELKFTTGKYGPTEPGHFFAINTGMVSPMSRGSVSLNSSNPLGPPLINPGLLSNEFDVLVLREGIKKAEKFVTAPAWKDYIIAQTPDLANITTDADLEQYIRNTASSSSHLVGSAGMSPRGASYGVVDPDLVLKGASGLRIIDASVLPIVTSAHTQAPTYVVGERGADLIKETWM